MLNRSDRFYPLFLLGVMGISLSICLAACSNAGRRMATVFKWNTKITVILDQDANQNSAIAVDVVSPLTDTTEGALMKNDRPQMVYEQTTVFPRLPCGA